ncbi:MAG: hypothetical protein RLZZ383_970 [Pseudomonadota bacterium]|jgi:hypothetical protein
MPAAMRSRFGRAALRIAVVVGVGGLCACRGRGAAGTEADPYEGYRRTPGTPVAQSASDATTPRENTAITPGVLVPTEGALTLSWGDETAPQTAVIPVADGGLRVGDLPTFAYPTGFVRLAVRAVQATDERAGLAATAWLADAAGEPQFLLIELKTVSALTVRLDDQGATAEATAVLGVQLGPRMQELAGPVRVARGADGQWRLTSVTPIDVDLEAFGDATARARFAAVAPGVAPRVQASLDVAFRTGTSDEVPVFVRPAITLQDATVIPVILEKEVDDYEEASRRVAQEGVSRQAQAFMTRERHTQLRGATRAIFQRWQGGRQGP